MKKTPKKKTHLYYAYLSKQDVTSIRIQSGIEMLKNKVQNAHS